MTLTLVVGTISLAAVTPFARSVLDAVDLIPAGKVMSYSDVADYISAGSGRAVGTVMARYGAEVPWHRVLRSDGSCAPGVRDRQVALLRSEDVAMDGSRVDMTRARWDGRSRPKLVERGR
jgi:alkylated DNA nucleotide flippase Atl1